MKKSLLFIMPSLSSGGAEKSLITLLGLIDYEKYDVDLFLFRKEGLFLPNVPKQVNITDGGENYRAFDAQASEYIKSNLKKFNAPAILNRISYSNAIKKGNRQNIWRCLKKALPGSDKHYDAAIGYLEGNAVYYCVDCVNADTKIGYIHSDYSKLPLDKNFDALFFTHLNYLIGVSEKCTDILKETFPDIKTRICLIENINSPESLKKLSAHTCEEFVTVEEKIILTVGRISPPKGYDTAVEAARIMNENGVPFKWFAIGKGELKADIEEKIARYSLRDKFILLGERANPYPYIDCCDIYVQPSHFEGKSIAIDEAKAFAKPIVATKFSTVFDQLSDNETALLAEINPQSVAEKITQLIEDDALCKKLSDNLKQSFKGNEEELLKFYSLIN